ncbi:hypothetical protein [Thauera butanivorans]|uniref:hypothetical protein n=1 Tax=Thauera butanivorans TaxID=86174 RepID=UPI00083828F9|nr:hypothetical protein [Thauera butanivorans]
MQTSAHTPHPATEQGLLNKFSVSRLDGRDAPGGDRHGARYFVLDLDHDAHAKEAVRTYIDSCEDDYPLLARDLRTLIADPIVLGEFVTMPETTLPDGSIVPSFKVGQYLCSKRADGTPWVEVSHRDAIAACERAGTKLLTERQALAIAFDIAAQDINWTGGKVGEGRLYQGLHKGNVDCAQGPDYQSDDPDERRWHQLSNGQRIFDVAGNAFAWIFDDVQGDAEGLVARPFAPDSISLQAPHPSLEKGMGWRPTVGANWSGSALIRGGSWNSGRNAGAFYLSVDWPSNEWGCIGFRCTLPIGA